MTNLDMDWNDDSYGVFLDPEDGETFGDGWDAHGVDVVGEDEDGAWWGTWRAAWVLSPARTVIHVMGWRGAVDVSLYFLGTEEEALAQAAKWRVEVIGCEEARVAPEVEVRDRAGATAAARADV